MTHLQKSRTLFNVGASVLLVYAAAMAAQRDGRFLCAGWWGSAC